MRERFDKRYLAGLYDGKGHVQILKNGTLRVGLRVSGDVPMKLKYEFGGSCFKNKGKFWWRIQGIYAIKFLEGILPFLQVTKEQVEKIVQEAIDRELDGVIV